MPGQSAMPPATAATTTTVRALGVPGQGAGLLTLLFPHLAALCMDRVEDTGEAVVIVASCQAASACCPRCGQESSRVAAARLAGRLGVPVHPSTVLCLVTALPEPRPRIAGALPHRQGHPHRRCPCRRQCGTRPW